LALAPLAVSARTSPSNPRVTDKLRVVATRARDRTSWGELRRFAESAGVSEERALAFFALGYREYKSGEYDSALADLRRAAGYRFPLQDYAEYYRAAAARQAGQPDEVKAALDGFSARHPRSALRLEALKLLATVLLEEGRAGWVIEILTAEPQVRQRPALALLLARAYRDAGRPGAAAAAIQDIYYAFPTVPQAKAAKGELSQLKTELGRDYPVVPIEIKTARAEILQRRRRYSAALQEYGLLLRTYPKSPHVGRWKVGQAGAMIGLRRTSQVIEALKHRFSDDREIDARRLAMLVEAYRRRGDALGVVRTLGELADAYPESPAYASALDEAGNFFVREGDWGKASIYYRRLIESFPQSELVPEANWRIAWAHYLERDFAKATVALVSHLQRYPESSQMPAVLYWLGRLAEERGSLGEAHRFGNNYYSLQAEALLKKPRLRRTAKVSQQDSSTAALAAGIPPPAAPSLPPCAPPMRSEILGPFQTLDDLGLGDLAEQYLRFVLSDHPAQPEVSLVLGRKMAKEGRVDLALFTAQRVVRNYHNYGFSRLPREIWGLLYPRTYQTLVARHARAQGLDPNLVMGLIRQESAFNPRATSRSNARGLMQVLPRTVSRRRSRRRTAARRLYDPAYNLRFGCGYLQGRLKAFGGKVEQALAAYHAGPTRVRRWVEGREFSEPAEFLESIPIPATRAYVERVLRDAAIYRQLINGTARFADCRSAFASAGGE
jgi:soluble lytic murein transglycosylase